MNNKSAINTPTTADLTGSASPADMAQREGWDPTLYTVVLSEHIRATTVPLDAQRERLAALAGCGAGADKATADVLAQHFSILEALHHRFSQEAVTAMKSSRGRAPEDAERYLAASLRAQRAALAVLSALKTLRESPSPNFVGGK